MTWIEALFGVLAFLYASVGHGGGSGYLAAMSLIGVQDPNLMRSTALFLNLFVSSIAFIGFKRLNYFDLKLFLYLIVGSVPFAFIGGRIELEVFWYHIALALFLSFSSLRLLGFLGKWKSEKSAYSFIEVAVFGALIGLLSGIIGIGGGILLSPIILMKRWADAKTTAGISALFILLNSLSGIGGLYFSSNFELHPNAYYWIILVVLGGTLGAWWGSSRLSQKGVRYLLVGVLTLAAIKLIVSL